MKGVQDFLALFAKEQQWETKFKNVFTWRWWVALKLKTNIKYYVYKEVRLLHNTLTLYAKVFFVFSTIYSSTFVIQGSFLKIWDKIQALV